MCTDFNRLTIEDAEHGLSGTSYFARLFDVSLETQQERDANITLALDKARKVQAEEAAIKAGTTALLNTIQAEAIFTPDTTESVCDNEIRSTKLAEPGRI